MAKVTDVMQGTLDLLILKALALTPMHGWGIRNRRWVISYWRQTPNNRIARLYELTPAGKRALEDEIAVWRSYTSAMDLVIEARQ